MWGPIETSGPELQGPRGAKWGRVGLSGAQWSRVGLSEAGEGLGIYWNLIKYSKSNHFSKSNPFGHIFGPATYGVQGPIQTSGAEWGPEGAAWSQVGPSRVEWGAVLPSRVEWGWGGVGHVLEPNAGVEWGPEGVAIAETSLISGRRPACQGGRRIIS